MEKKLNNGDDSTKRKSIDDRERRRQVEKSHAVEQQRRSRTMDGPRLFRDVMVKLRLQRQPAEREHINTKIYEASMSLEKLTSADHAREEQRNFEPTVTHLEELKAEADLKAYDAYARGFTAGLKAQEMTAADLKDPNVLEGYIKGLEDHRTDLYIGRDIENAQVPQSDFERVNQLLTPAYASRLKNIEPQNLEVKSDGPELGR